MIRICGFVLGGTMLLAACGSGDGGGDANENAPATAQQSAAAATDPCSLVTEQEVSEVVGEPIVAKRAAEGSCTYETADASASSVTIELNQTDAAGQMDVARGTAGALGQIGGAVADQGGAGADANMMLSDSGDTPKVGDEAFFGPNQQLSVRKGNSYIAVSPPIMRSRMSGGNPLLSGDDKKKMALAIAEKAVARLP